MSSDAVVVMSVRFQNPAEMRLAQNDDVIQTLTPDSIRSAVRRPAEKLFHISLKLLRN
jgi:hypothetical protein